MLRIIVAGTVGSGKSSTAKVILAKLTELGAQVTLIEEDEGVVAGNLNDAESIIRDKKPEIVISTQQILRGATSEQVDKAWMSFPAAKVQVHHDERFARSVSDPAITQPL